MIDDEWMNERLMTIEDPTEGSPKYCLNYIILQKHVWPQTKGRPKSYGRKHYTILHEFPLRVVLESPNIANI